MTMIAGRLADIKKVVISTVPINAKAIRLRSGSICGVLNAVCATFIVAGSQIMRKISPIIKDSVCERLKFNRPSPTNAFGGTTNPRNVSIPAVRSVTDERMIGRERLMIVPSMQTVAAISNTSDMNINPDVIDAGANSVISQTTEVSDNKLYADVKSCRF